MLLGGTSALSGHASYMSGFQRRMADSRTIATVYQEIGRNHSGGAQQCDCMCEVDCRRVKIMNCFPLLQSRDARPFTITGDKICGLEVFAILGETTDTNTG